MQPGRLCQDRVRGCGHGVCMSSLDPARWKRDVRVCRVHINRAQTVSLDGVRDSRRVVQLRLDVVVLRSMWCPRNVTFCGP